MRLNQLRERLDMLDEQIMALLSERAQVIIQVAEFKRQHNLPVYIPAREASIIERLCTLNAGPLSREAIAHIYRTIIEEMRRLEREQVAP